MKRFMAIGAAVLCMVGLAHAQGTMVVYYPSYNNATPGILGTNGGGVAGQFFKATASVTLNSLGFIDLNNVNPTGGGSGDGLLGSYELGIWDTSTKQLLASTTVTTDSTLIGGFRYSPIAPTTLYAGENFVIGALLPENLQDAYLINISDADGFDFSGIGGGGIMPGATTLSYPSGSLNSMGGMSVGLVNASDAIVAPVPEPTSVALASLGGLVLLWRRRSKTACEREMSLLLSAGHGTSCCVARL